jgi:hypothetical protein
LNTIALKIEEEEEEHSAAMGVELNKTSPFEIRVIAKPKGFFVYVIAKRLGPLSLVVVVVVVLSAYTLGRGIKLYGTSHREFE